VFGDGVKNPPPDEGDSWLHHGPDILRELNQALLAPIPLLKGNETLKISSFRIWIKK
jgi:hypothetical protein